MSSDKKIKLSFQKGVPSFIAKLKEQTGYQEPELGDKFRESTEAIKAQTKDAKDDEYDVQNAQIVSQPAPVVVEEQPAKLDFKPAFKLTDKKERNQAIIQKIVKKSKISSYKLSSETQQQFEARIEHEKDRVQHQKTKKILKPNKNLLSFDD